jgi:hypothetical protein
MVGQADDVVFRPVRTGNPFEEAVERLLAGNQARRGRAGATGCRPSATWPPA